MYLQIHSGEGWWRHWASKKGKTNVPSLGLVATSSGLGFRIDGSIQYGFRLLNPSRSVGKLAREGGHIFAYGDRLDGGLRRQFEEFVRYARDRNITVISVAAPFAPEVVDVLEASDKQGIYHEFRSAETVAWLKSLGIKHFDFTNIASFSGLPNEFVDPMHPSETAVARMVATMLNDGEFRNLFPNIDRDALSSRIDQALWHTVFGVGDKDGGRSGKAPKQAAAASAAERRSKAHDPSVR